MSTILDIIQQTTDLQSAVDAKQQDIADAFAVKNQTISDQAATIVDLQNQLANAGSQAQIDQIAGSLTAIQSDVASTPTA